jgi:endoribonuclease LACTB2
VAIVLEPTQVAPGIEMLSVRTPTLPPATHTNSYVLGERELLLVEPATSDARELVRIEAWLDARLDAGAELKAVVLTHHHADHVGGASEIAARFGVPVWAHTETARRLGKKGPRIARELADGEVLLVDADRRMRVVHTPGHAPGHVCLLDETSGALIAGDMVAGVGTILIAPGDGDMTEYLASLARMDELGASQLLPAHGLPIANAREKLRGYIAHRLAREARVLAALTGLGRAATLAELVPIAYDDTPVLAWPLAALSSEAHLVKLVRDGRVSREGSAFRAL